MKIEELKVEQVGSIIGLYQYCIVCFKLFAILRLAYDLSIGFYFFINKKL